MLYLLLASIFSVIIAIVFKLFERYEIDANQAIVVNYITCVITGCFWLGIMPFEGSMLHEPYMPLMVFMGFVFMAGFNLVRLTIRYFGMAISTVAQRMSLGLSGGFAIWFYQEAYSTPKIIGIGIALSAVLFINIPHKKEEASRAEVSEHLPKWALFLPLIIFLFSTFIEISLQYMHAVYHMKPAIESIVLFASAAIVGTVSVLIRMLFFKEKLRWKNLVAGICLGVPNFFSIYLLLMAIGELDGSTVYALTNIIIVATAALVGFGWFKERLSVLNVLGIILALLSIFLITLN